MKKIFTLLVFNVVITLCLFAQAPHNFKYQLIARDLSGTILSNRNIGLQISILKGSANGLEVYKERFFVNSNSNGLINLEIGNGNPVSGNINLIDWGNFLHFLKLELDPAGGTNYLTMGTSQLLSVPYALYAERAGNVVDTSNTNELQTMSISNDTIYLTNGGHVKVPAGATGPQGVIGLTGPEGPQGPAGIYAAGTGINISGGILTNTLPDQAITILSGTGISVLGAYPNFSINNTNPNLNHTGEVTGSSVLTIANSAITAAKINDGAVTSSKINGMSATNGQVLKYIGSVWTPGTDNNTTYSAGTGLSLSGTTFNSVWTTNVNDIYANNTGFVGIGTSSPTSALHVNGSLRITDESEGVNKILTSDIDGNASWKTPVLVNVNGSKNYIPKFSSSSKSELDTSLLFQTGSRIGIGSTNPSGRMMIQADASSSDAEPLFEIKSKTGKTVMIVYQDSVHFYVADDASKSNNKGSFAVSGQSTAKTVTSNLFYLNPFNLLTGQNAGRKLSSPIAYSGKYNTFIGFEAGYSDTSGSSNVFLGKSAGYFNTTGGRNVFIGEQTGYNNSNGSFNSFIGYKSGYANQAGGYNTFLGYQAGFTNIGSDNTYIGYKAGNLSGSGGGNVFIGSKAGMKTYSPSQNIYIGELAGYKADGDYNVYVGYGAGGDSLINAGSTNSGSRNSFYGYKAGYNNNSGSKNVFVGDSAGYSNSYGNSNVFLGNGAGRNADNSFNNILIGENAGAGLSNGSNNILIGSYFYYQATGGTNGYGNINNQVRLGDPSITSFYCQGAYAATTSNPPNMFVGTNGQIMRSTAITPAGSGVSSQIAYWSDANTLTSNPNLYVDNINNRLGLGTALPRSSLDVNGSVSLPVNTVAVDITLNETHYTLFVVSLITITLPVAATCKGRIYIIKKITGTAGNVTIEAAGTETIDGSLTKTISTQYQSVVIQSNGSNWYIIN